MNCVCTAQNKDEFGEESGAFLKLQCATIQMAAFLKDKTIIKLIKINDDYIRK
jgi:hypothetical protein